MNLRVPSEQSSRADSHAGRGPWVRPSCYAYAPVPTFTDAVPNPAAHVDTNNQYILADDGPIYHDVNPERVKPHWRGNSSRSREARGLAARKSNVRSSPRWYFSAWR